MDQLRGQIESMRHPGSDAWGVATLLCGSAREKATIVGHLLGVEVGDTVEVDGSWSTHPRFGKQFRAKQVRTVVPTDASGVIEWLRARLPAIGRKLATALVEKYGVPGVWGVLDAAAAGVELVEGGGVEAVEHRRNVNVRDPAALAPLVEIPGITLDRALDIAAAYRQHRHERDLMVELKRYQLTDRQAARVVERFGADRALEALRADPYALSREVAGFGWERSDAVARAMGLPLDHPARVRAVIEHLLGEAAQRGHVYVPAPKLTAMAVELLGLGGGAGSAGAAAGAAAAAVAMVRREGKALVAAGKLVQREARIYAPEMDAAEQSVAESVARLVAGVGGAEREGSEAA